MAYSADSTDSTGRNRLVLFNVLIAAAAILFLARGLDTPVKYVFGTPAEAVKLSTSCEVSTVYSNGGGSSTAECPATAWRIGRQIHYGTLHADASRIDHATSGELVFTGKARAFGNNLYDDPGSGAIFFAAALLSATGVGVLTLLWWAVALILSAAGRRGALAFTGPGVYTKVIFGEIVLALLAAGVFTVVAGQV